MRARVFVLITLVAIPATFTAQVRRPTGRGGAATPQPAPLPPEIPAVARALAYKRSRWATEAYSLVTSALLANPFGGVSRYTSFGAGTRAGYRYTDRMSMTLDMTASMVGGAADIQTLEAGTRYSPASLESSFRPYVDVRAAFVHASDAVAPLTNGPLGSGTRYSRGPAAIAGAGFDYSLTPSLALTGGLSAGRGWMSTYRMTASAPDPGNGSTYWMTTYRVVLGLRFNPVSNLHLAQNPRS